MVRRAVWSAEARAEHDAYIDWLAEYNDEKAREIQVEIEDWVDLVARRPGIGNPGRWPGFRVHGHRERHKLIIYEVIEGGIAIAAFRDMRQDNSRLRLKPRVK